MNTKILLSTEGKEALRRTIRSLREILIAQLKEEAEREYRLGVALDKAKLSEAKAQKRARLEAWAEEQSRADWPKDKKGELKKLSDKNHQLLRERYLEQAVKEAAHTLINRLVILRILEVGKLMKPAVLSGGWKSPGYLEFQDYAGALCNDPTDDSKGYAALLQLIFQELAVELPGVFGRVGLTSLFPVPASVLREVVEALNQPELDSAWADDTTLGWVYQFWNDPERELLDDKINGGGKIEPHEIASKTQMFTERYMVEWLLQNSLGQTWLAMCKKNGWTPDFEKIREGLELRRAEWRGKLAAGEVAADALMPINNDLEDQWKYWVPQPMPEDAPLTAPERLLDLRLLDPACGSGHFLVIAFDLLAALYREEGRHLAASGKNEKQRTEAQIAKAIIEHNLHGIDIDPRAIQIAAAAVWLKAKLFAADAQISRMNLVAPTFKLAALPAEDAALVELQKRLKAEVGISEELSSSLVSALNGVDHLGTLLRVDKSIRTALLTYEKEHTGLHAPKSQLTMFGEAPTQTVKVSLEDAEASVMKQLGKFLEAHDGASDLGLRLEGEQLAAGVRFLQLAREGSYDVVVGNPPYQGTAKMAQSDWFKKHYPRSKADLYACFLERGLELAKPGGSCAMITMRGWMFLSSYEDTRSWLVQENSCGVIADLHFGAFSIMKDVSVSMSVLYRRVAGGNIALAIRPASHEVVVRDLGQPKRNESGLSCPAERFEFDVAKLSGIEGTPLIYWWDEEFLEEYVKAPKLGDVAPVRQGMATSNNSQFLRLPHEVSSTRWVPYIKGAAGRKWFESVECVINWKDLGLGVKALNQALYGSYTRTIKNEAWYFQPALSYNTIGSGFFARIVRFPSVFDVRGSCAFPPDLPATVALMNSRSAARALEALNPGVNFQVGDVNRLPLFEMDSVEGLFAKLGFAFTQHESHREASVEFKQPGPSPWRYAQDWAQRAVDRKKGEPLPPYEEELDQAEPTAFVSFAIGVAFGRFGENGEGILDLSLPPGSARAAAAIARSDVATATADAAVAEGSEPFVTPNIEPFPRPINQKILQDGILFVSAASHISDSLKDAACAKLLAAWEEHAPKIFASGKSLSLNEWLRKDFFAYHKSLYENRPIYFPLSSEKKNFVAWLSIHRWVDNSLQSLLASHLHPLRQKLEGEMNDLNEVRASGDKKQQANAEKQYAKNQELFKELEDFIRLVTLCAEKGAPPTDPKCPAREVDAPFKMDLDDGVMINSAALWPLLEAQWKEPKKWWKELCTADGRKDYDWAHLAARYFPTRVDAKCQEDPSLGVAHGCFWKYHPAKAFAWELRLQDEISADFTIDEGAYWNDGGAWDDGGTWDDNSRGASDKYREKFLRENKEEVEAIRAKEEQRRERNRKKAEKAAEDSDAADDADDADSDSDSDPEVFELRAE